MSQKVSRALGLLLQSTYRLGPAKDRARSILSASGNGADRRWPLRMQITDDALMLTSGTSSRPKMVPLTHAAICQYASGGARLGTWTSGPIAECAAALPCARPGLWARRSVGGRIECGLHAGVECRGFLELAEGVSSNLVHGGCRPSIWRCYRRGAAPNAVLGSGPSLRVIRSGTSTLPPNVRGELEALFGVPVIDTYGMTEAASQITENPSGAAQASVLSAEPAGAEIAVSWTTRADGERPATVEGSALPRIPPSRGGTTMMPSRPRPRFGTAGSTPVTSDTWTRTITSSSSVASRTSSIQKAEGGPHRGRRGVAEPSSFDEDRRFLDLP